jgi:hypothetical protein
MPAHSRLCLTVLFCGLAAPLTVSAGQMAATQQTPPLTSPSVGNQPDSAAKLHQPKPNPDASGKYHVGDGVKAPKLIYSVEPEFSEKLRKKKVPGSCKVSFTVDIDGNPKDVHVISSTPDTNDKKLHDAVIEMRNNCMQTAKQYRFEPGTYKDKPVPVEQTVDMLFQIY